MTAITTINTEMPRLVAGQLADGGYKDVDSCHNEDTTPIYPGTFIVVGTTDTDFGAKNPSAQNQLLKGVALFGQSYQPITELDASGGYLTGITFDYLRHGRVPVTAKAAMTTSSAVHVQVIADTGAPVGIIRPDADAGKTLDCSSFCKVVEGGDATNPPVLEVDMTGAANAVSD